MKKLFLTCSLSLLISQSSVVASSRDDALASLSRPHGASVTVSTASMSTLYQADHYPLAYGVFEEKMDLDQTDCGFSSCDFAQAMVNFALSGSAVTSHKGVDSLEVLLARASHASKAEALILLNAHDTARRCKETVSAFLTSALKPCEKHDADGETFFDLVEAIYKAKYANGITGYFLHKYLFEVSQEYQINLANSFYKNALQSSILLLDNTLTQDGLAQRCPILSVTAQATQYIDTHAHAGLTPSSSFCLNKALFLLRQVAFEQIIGPRKKEVIDRAIAEAHNYYALFPDDEANEHDQTYVNLLINAYDKLGDAHKVAELLEQLPEELGSQDYRFLSGAIKAHSALGNTHHALPYIHKIQAILKNSPPLGHDRTLIEFAIEAAQKIICAGMYEEGTHILGSCQALIEKSPAVSAPYDVTLCKINPIKFYVAVQKAMSIKSLSHRRAALKTAVALIQNSPGFALDDEFKVKFNEALYVSTLYEKDSASVKRRLNAKEQLLKLGQTVEGVRSLAKSASATTKQTQTTSRRQSRSGSASKEMVDGVELFLKQKYVHFSEQSLEQLSEFEADVEAIGSRDLHQMHSALQRDCAVLKEQCQTAAASDANRFVDIMKSYNDLQARFGLFKTLAFDARQERIRVLKALALRSEGASGASSSREASFMPNLRSLFPHEKGISRVSPSRSDAASSSSSSSAAPAVRMYKNVVTSFSKDAKKDMKILRSMPGMEAKLNDYMKEIKADPYLVHMDMASGRAEALKLDDHIYSRRLTKRDRLVYRVLMDEDGIVHVEILRLLTHYKRLNLN